MKIIKAYPPNYVQIRTAFPQVVGRQGILYAWGDRIYNPSGVNLPWWLKEHEEVHGSRQSHVFHPQNTALGTEWENDAIRTWWDKYITDPNFRLWEEILAHRAEWEVYSSLYVNRAQQKTYLASMAERLSGPLYNNMIGLAEAVKEITRA